MADVGSSASPSMISSLNGWSANSLRAASSAISSRTNGWDSAMISRMRASIRSRSSGVNVPAVRPARRELEVVVEAVLDRRADGEGGPREQVEHRLGQHVGRRVADRVTGRGRTSAVMIETASPSASGHTRSRSTPLTSAITAALAEPATDGRRQLAGGGARAQPGARNRPGA